MKAYIYTTNNSYLNISHHRVKISEDPSFVSHLSKLTTHLRKIILVICLLFSIGIGDAFCQVTSATATDGGTYVVAYYYNSKYYALPNNTSAGTWAATEVTVNGSGKVTTENPPTWTLVEGSTSGQFYLTYESGGNTYYLYKNGTSNSNYNIRGDTSNKNYWEFTAGTGGNAGKYQVLAVGRGTYHTCLTLYESQTKFEVYNTSGYKIILLELASSCDNTVTVNNGGSSTNGSITSITGSPVETCSSTATDRQVSIVVTPNTGYTAPTDLTLSASTGGITSTKVSRTDNGDGTYTFVYRYNQNNNGSATYNAVCVAKTTTISFNQNGGDGGQTTSKTATYGQAMPTPITCPTRNHYDFGGYYDGAGGTGTQYYTNTGASARTWNKDASTATLYAKWTEHGLTNYRTRCCNELAAPTNPNETPSNEGGTLYWDAVAGATGYEVNIDGGGWVSTGNGTTCSYTVTGKACGGTSVSWQVRATGDGTTNCAAGAPTTVRNFSTSSCSCTGTYSFHYQHSGAWNAENICFSPVAGATNNYLTDELSLPYAENYKIAWQGVDQSYTSSTGFNGNMPFFHNRDKKFGANPQSGNLGGGKGKFHVYHDSGSTNKYVSFIPTGYTLNFGTGDTWTNDSTKTFTGKTNAWDETEWYTDLITLKDGTIGKKIFVGLQTASGYVWCDPYSQKDNLSGLRTKSGSGESWVTGGLTTSYPNKTGKFRLYANSGDKNWYVTFVPHFQLKYNANGGTGTMSPLPATPVSCEETSGNRTVTVATSSFTAPTGKVFDHWNTAADNSGSNVSTGSYTLTGDVTLYAIWRDADYTVTLNQSPSVGATLTGATNTAHYGGTINISASEPTGYQFVNWTSSPSVTFADATSASTSFTMPASNVTITANYVQVYTVTFVHHDKGTFSGGSTEILVPTSSNTITLSTVTDVSCGFYDTFEGWIASGSEYSESTSKPATVYAGGSSYTVSSDVTLRALYSKCEGDGGEVYAKVTTDPGDWSGTYLIINEDYGKAMNGSETQANLVTTSNNVAVTISNSQVVSNSTTDTYAFTIAPHSTASGKYSICSHSGYYIGSNSASNAINATATETTYSNAISISDGVLTIGCGKYKDNDPSKAEYRLMFLGSGAGSPIFKYYPNTQGQVCLYKKQSLCTKYYATNPSCVKPVGVHIVYNANGGEMTCSNQNKTYKVVEEVNQYPQLASVQDFCTSATRSGYTLVGWNTQANGLGTTYNINQHYYNLPVSGELDGENWVTLNVYAMWASAVSFNLGNATGGTGVPAVVEEDGGFMLPEPTAAQIGTIPCGYSFYGWSESSVAATSTKPTLYMPGTKYTGSYRTLYAVYRLAGDGGNPDLFSLSYMVSSTKYYVAAPSGITTAPSTWTYPYTKGGKFVASTNAEDAVAFGMKTNPDNTSYKQVYWVYDGDEDEKAYLQYSSGASVEFKSQEDTYNQQWTVTGTTTLTFVHKGGRYLSGDADEIGCPSTPGVTTFTKEEASTTTYTYATNPSCETTATLAFVTNGGTLNYPDTYDASNYVDLTVGTTVYLPTATYPGEWVFEGWMKGSEVTSTDMRPESANFYTVTLNTTTYSAAPAGTTTFYAVYSKTVNDKQFDPVNGGTYKLFAIMSDGTTKKYMPVWDGNQTTLTPVTSCASTGDYTITPGTGVHAGQYQITHGSYTLGVRDDANTQFKNVADTWWNIEASTSGKGTYRITVVGSSNRCLSHGGTGFFGNYTRNDVNNPSQPGYRDMEIGECIYTEYTSTPENIPYITITGSPVKITSTNGERVYSPTKLHIEAHNFTGTRRINFSATNGFATNPTYVNCLADGSYSGDIDIYYEPTSDGTGNIVSSVLTASQAAESVTQTFAAIQGRNMPANFVIAVKSGTQWYALPDDCHSSGTPKAVAIEVNDPSAPTAATLVPHNTEWRLSDVVNSNSRPKDKVYFYEPNSTNNYTLYAGSAPNIQTNAQLSNVTGENSYTYEWGLATTDLCAYTISNANVNKNISIDTKGTFGTHATNIVSSTLYLLPITAYYEPAEFQVVEWKANSVVVMYLGSATKASVQVGGNDEGGNQTLSDVKVDHGVFELAASGLTSAAFESLQIVFKNNGGTEIGRNYVAIPAIISGEVLTSAYESQKDLAESNDVVILKNGKLTTTGTGTDGTSYKFTNVTVYGGGKLDIASGTKLGVTGSLILRAGGVVAGAYDYVYPQLNLGGTLTNTSGKFYYEYVTDYTHWYHYVLPFDGTLNTIKYPTEYYGSAVAANNTGSWIIKRYAGEIRATGNYTAWVDIESESATVASAGHGYIYWGAPKKVTANGVKDRQAWGIQRIAMSKAAETAKTEEAGDKTVTGLGSYSGVSGNSGKNNDQGWNLIGNPYMVNLTGLNSSSLQVGQLVHTDTHPWDGKWEWDNTDPAAGGLRYVTIPDNHFDNYTAQTMSWFTAENPMKTGRTFFVQIAGANTSVAFAAANRASLMPALFAKVEESVDIETGIVMSDESKHDEVNFWIKDGKTAEYEYNADYPKTPNSSNFNIYGVHSHGDLSWIAISPEIAEGSMAIGYQVPAAGEYRLSLSETYVSDKIEQLLVTDHAMNPEVTTNLMVEDYIFLVNQAETNNERFTVSIKIKSGTQITTDIDDIRGDSEHPYKFIYRDKMYIKRGDRIYDATGKQVREIQ